MRRLIAIAFLAVIAAGVAVAGLDTSAQGSSSYTVDAIFNDAKGIIPGQIVKIAGAKVGTVSNVTLTPDFKARIEMSIDGRFAPFYANATCQIEPESLISENFLDCDPGTPSDPPLPKVGGFPATVPVSADYEPVSITDLFNIWDVPTSDRLTVFLNELGAGVAGQGANINAILAQVNPTLGYTRQAIREVLTQKSQLQNLITESDPIVAQLAQDPNSVRQFIHQLASFTDTTAAHANNFAATIHRLPALLSQAGPALRNFNTFASAATPILQDFHTAAPEINSVVAKIGPFGTAGTTALKAIGPTFANTSTVLHNSLSTVAVFAAFAKDANVPAELLDQLAVSLRGSGVIENFLSFAYGASSLLSRFDSISHVGLVTVNTNNSNCDTYSTTPIAGCSANFGSNSATASSSASNASAALRARTTGGAQDDSTDPLQNLLNYLLK